MDQNTMIQREIDNIIARGEEAALVSVASIRAAAPTEKQNKMLVRADGSVVGSIGGGSVETQVIQKAIMAIEGGQSLRIRVGVNPNEEKMRGMDPGGKLKYFIEPISFLPSLHIFGGGSISIPLTRIGKVLGFKVVVIDNEAEFATRARHPEADLVLAGDYNKVLTEARIGKSSYIVIATRNHQYDEVVLELALKTGADYIGMAACSTAKKEALFSRLIAKGMPKEPLAKVHAPIGIRISAQTIEEMALSILAEIVEFRRFQFV
ncbi:XdhC family protein [Chloroflexota bacterium]